MALCEISGCVLIHFASHCGSLKEMLNQSLRIPLQATRVPYWLKSPDAPQCSSVGAGDAEESLLVLEVIG